MSMFITVPVSCHNSGMESDNDVPVSSEKSGRERSGRARMERLTPEERRDLGKKAAERRWGPKSTESAMLIYQSEDRKTRIDVRVENETVWLSQSQMADLFQVSKQNVSLH